MCLFLFCPSVFIVMLFMNRVLRESVWREAQRKQLNPRLGPAWIAHIIQSLKHNNLGWCHNWFCVSDACLYCSLLKCLECTK